MTTTLLTSLIRMGILILAPWLFFSKTDKDPLLNVDKQDHEERKKSIKSSNIPVHFISLQPADLEDWTDNNLTQQLREYYSVVTDVLAVCWLTVTVSIRHFCSKICYTLTPKPSMDAEVPLPAQDLGSEDIQVLKAYTSSKAVDSLLHHELPASTSVQRIVPKHYLLQFAALTDDVPAQRCLQKLGNAYEPGKKHGLLGTAEKNDWYKQPWEKRVDKHKHDVTFTMDRKYLRDGLYVYRTTTVFKNAKIDDFRHFILNYRDRLDWDYSAVDITMLQTEEEASETSRNTESTFLFSENKMPGPLCNREYVAARRVWNRSDGGCYSIMKSAEHPQAPPRRGRNVRVDDYTSAFVLRPLSIVNGERIEAVEMLSLYYDNAKMRPMAYNIAMNASMWKGILTVDHAFRRHQSTLYPVNNHHQSIEDILDLDGDEEEEGEMVDQESSLLNQQQQQHHGRSKGLLISGVLSVVTCLCLRSLLCVKRRAEKERSDST